MILIDLGVDFNEYVWKNGRNWDFYEGFYGKQWIWSTVSNFGGRSTAIGNLEFYLNEPLKALASPNRGNLPGYGASPEGIENNEIQYELFSSAGWSKESKDLMTFLKNYSIARYGAAPEEIMTFWSEMLQSVHNAFSDNARWHWQRRQPCLHKDEMQINEHYYKAIESFLAAADKLGENELYKIDALQWEAFAYCGRADEKLLLAHEAVSKKQYKKALAYEKEMEELLMKADNLLCQHPLLNLERWEKLGEAAGTSAEESAKFAFQARKLITTWDGTDHTDYACRVWGGLIEKWYIPRVRYYFDEVCAGRKNPNMRLVENIAPWF
jgi:alpha-N-acetylglucosaminidase